MNKRHIIPAVLVVLAISVPFLNKPYHIDDTVVLTVAQKILEKPYDPFYGEINWFGYNQPMWESTTNPPFLSYYLAPFAAISDYSEIVLHLGMMLFLFMLAGSMIYLSERFTKGSLFPLLFVLFSPAIVVSGNVMRDVPAAGLGAAALALFIYGTDRDDRRYLFWGAFLAGIAVLTKYSSIILLPVMALYPFFKKKYGLMLWVWPILALLAAWCIHNQIMYGEMHVVYLTIQRRAEHGFPWREKFYSALLILGSAIYLLPVLLRDGIQRKDMYVVGGGGLVAVASWWAPQFYFEGGASGEYVFWSVTGGVLLYIALYEGLRRGIYYLKNQNDEEAADSLFLFAWLCAPILFSIILISFQAVRHQLYTLIPLTLILFRYLEREPRPSIRVQRIWLIVLICLQGVMSILVNSADYEYANTYRDFADYAKEKWVSEDYNTWYLAHWGWKFYADRAGFRQVHGGEAYPEEGDILFWPKINIIGFVFIGKEGVFEEREDFLELPDKQEPVEKVVYPGIIPIRTMNFRGASFYAVVGTNVPYKFFQDIELETMSVYRVQFDENEESQ